MLSIVFIHAVKSNQYQHHSTGLVLLKVIVYFPYGSILSSEYVSRNKPIQAGHHLLLVKS